MPRRRQRAGAYIWNDVIRQGKDAVQLLRDDIDELRAANIDDPAILNFLLQMSGRLDTIFDSFSELWEIGQEIKTDRLDNGDNDDE